jgi:UMF1 family MFS transporter
LPQKSLPFAALVRYIKSKLHRNSTDRVLPGSFAPVTLEQLARESGVLRSDGVTPCLQAAAKEGSSRLTKLLIRAAASADDKDQCIVRPFGRETSTASFALYTFSIAVFLQALVLITFSPVADYGVFSGRNQG